jgi:hypothetical protein
VAAGESNSIILPGTPSIHKISAETVKLATAGWVPDWKRPDREPRRGINRVEVLPPAASDLEHGSTR